MFMSMECKEIYLQVYWKCIAKEEEDFKMFTKLYSSCKRQKNLPKTVTFTLTSQK